MNCRLLKTLFIFCSCQTILAQEPKLMIPIGNTDFSGVMHFSPDGKRILTGSGDGKTKIWDAASGILLANLKGHLTGVASARYSPDGKKIITASGDGAVKLWDAVSGLLIKDYMHIPAVTSAQYSPDGKKILTTINTNKERAKIWDAETGTHLFSLTGHNSYISSAFFSPDGKKIITASADSTIKIWNAANGVMLHEIKGFKSGVISAIISPDGQRIISTTAPYWKSGTREYIFDSSRKIVNYGTDGRIKIWNADSGTELFSMPIKSFGPIPLDFSPDGKKLFIADTDSTIKIWDLNASKFTGSLFIQPVNDTFWKGTHKQIQKFRVSPDGKTILLAILNLSFLKTIDAGSGKFKADLKGHSDYYSANFSPDGKKIISRMWEGPIKIWEINKGNLLSNIKVASTPSIDANFSPDGKKIIYNEDNFGDVKQGEINGNKRSTTVLDIASGKILREFKDTSLTTLFINDAHFSQDGEKIIVTLYCTDSVASPSGSIPQGNVTKIWDFATGNLIGEDKSWADFTPDGKHTIHTSWDHKLLYKKELTTGKTLFEIKSEVPEFFLPMMYPDGNKILNAFNVEGKKKIFDASTGKMIAELEGSDLLSVKGYTIRQDGTRIILASHNSSVKIWDGTNGKLLKDLNEIANDVNYSPDGKFFISSSNVSQKVWDSDGNLLKEIGAAVDGSYAYFSPDGKKIISRGADNSISIWNGETLKKDYSYLYIDNDDYIVIDDEGRFDGTEAARNLLYFTCGTEVIELEQVKDQLWVPNLAERIMSGETINAQKLSDLNICNLTPVVETIEQTALQYRFQITPRLGGLGASIVYVNGIEVKRYTPQQLIKQNDVYQLAIDKKEVQKFFIAGKENRITVKSLTAKSSISSRSVSINEKANEKSIALPNLYAVVVGVSDYKGEELDLSFAAKDAVDMANAIDASAKKLLNTDDKEHVFIYKLHTGAGRDKFPEKNSIKQVFTEIAAKAMPNDILLIFFAGHGVMEAEKNQFYFLTADASNVTVSGALKNVGISTDELSEWIKPQTMKAQKRILIFDACNSGQAIKEFISIGKTGQTFLASRGDDKGKQIKAVEKLNERSGMFILSASASNQKAYEIGKYNQGALTYSLLKAIKEEPDILEDRKYLNISRWFNAAEKSVNELARETGARQQPQIVSTTNFNIGVVDEEVRNRIILPFEKPLFRGSDFRNSDLRIDNLKLRTLVDKELDDIAGNISAASIIYSPEYDGVNVFAISGDYIITGNNVAISVILTKGGTEIKSKFEIKGLVTQPDLIAKSIVAETINWLTQNKH